MGIKDNHTHFTRCYNCGKRITNPGLGLNSDDFCKKCFGEFRSAMDACFDKHISGCRSLTWKEKQGLPIREIIRYPELIYLEKLHKNTINHLKKEKDANTSNKLAGHETGSKRKSLWPINWKKEALNCQRGK